MPPFSTMALILPLSPTQKDRFQITMLLKLHQPMTEITPVTWGTALT